MAWGYPYRLSAGAGQPVKVEGDQRSPAGIYRLGGTFGFAALPRPDHLVLKAGETICVDDPSSTAYNTIVSRRTIGPAVHGEDMRKVDLYRRGLFIVYPTDRATRAGSCIFVHVWRGPTHGTSGCVAMPEAQIAALQDFARDAAVIAILPEDGLEQFSKCLPSLDTEIQ
jgi:L,D-peptidoglycan transpeptidase YkuD (ErfK/YbiS/YcfS/YnhG family)